MEDTEGVEDELPEVGNGLPIFIDDDDDDDTELIEMDATGTAIMQIDDAEPTASEITASEITAAASSSFPPSGSPLLVDDDFEPTAMDITAAAAFSPTFSPSEFIVVKEEAPGIIRSEIPGGGGGGSSKKDWTQKEEDEARWTVADVFFKQRSLVEHQLHTFNEFLETGIQAMFKEATPVEVMPDHSPASIRISGLPRQARFWFGEVVVGKPVTSLDDEKKATCDVYPREARLRNITYAAPINIEMNLEVYVMQTTGKTKEKLVVQTMKDIVCIGKIPVMVKSKFCHLCGLSDEALQRRGDCAYDIGGYFIIKGSEKVLIAQEERCVQCVNVQFIKKNKTWLATCAPPYSGFYDYRSKTPVRLSIEKHVPLVAISLPRVLEPIPVVIVMRALGISTDKQVMEIVCYDLNDNHLMEVIRPSIEAADSSTLSFLKKQQKETLSTSSLNAIRLRNNALAYIGAKVRNNVGPVETAGREVLDLMFMHLGEGDTRKSYFLGYMVRQVCMTYLGRRREDDKDHYKNKRLDLAGQLMKHQFRKNMGHLQRDIAKQIQKHLGKDESLGPLKTFVSESLLTKSLQAAFTTGNWNTSEGPRSSGVVGDLKRMNPIATISQLRQIRHNLDSKSRPPDSARHPNFSYWARVCPVQTSDGVDCGLVKNISLTGILSSDTSEEPVVLILIDHGMEGLEEIIPSTLTTVDKVFLNGKWIGTLDNSDRVMETLKALRRSKALSEQTEMVKDDNQKELRIYTDAGRILRPLLVVQNQRLVLSKRHINNMTLKLNSEKPEKYKECWDYLLENGVVELLGIEEEERAMVAFNPDDLSKAQQACIGTAPVYTHSEINASFLMGLGAALIPFLEHNQASRNLYQSDKHCKQAIGLYTTNFFSRADASSHHLFYPQKPLITTRAAQILQKPELYSGQSAILAILCYGYNQEDSIVMNQASIDRGLFRSVHYKTHRGEERHNIDEHFSKPSTSDVKGSYNKSLDKVEDDGFPCIGEKLVNKDIVIGKTTAEVGNPKLMDTSTKLKTHQKGHVDQVMLTSEEDGHRIVKVRLRVTRAPQAGDKFSSMHGQKGVIGAVFPQVDLPFTQQGIVPDIIMNPHALPSRQTVGQILECLLGKVVAASGTRHYATPFSRIETAEVISQQLHESKFARGGCEYMCNGQTGLRLQALVTIGPTFYQRLDHMVEDKIKVRGNTGPVHLLTRQPVKDRNSQGGVKFGEMERDCMLGHGASATLRERYFLLSDPYKMNICQPCRRPATMDSSRIPKCQFCKSGKHIVQIQIPYACKLLWQELLSMGICVYMDTKLC